MSPKNQRMLRIHKPKSDNQSPVVVCWPDGARYVLTSEAYHQRGKLGHPTQMYDPNGRRIHVEER